MLRHIAALIIGFSFMASANAERFFKVQYNGSSEFPLSPVSCLRVAQIMFPSNLSQYGDPTCSAAFNNYVMSPIVGGTMAFAVVFQPNSSGGTAPYYTGVRLIFSSGSCTAGAAASIRKVAVSYVNATTEEVLQQIQHVADVRFASGGCLHAPTGNIPNCYYHPHESINNVALAYCDAEFAENGSNAGADSNYTADQPVPFTATPPGDPSDPGDGGGGTDPGDGGGGDPGDGGTDPGDGGGGTDPGDGGGGTDPGDGGTDPGDGGGGTDPGDGGTDPGDGNTACGGAGQVACEAGTPNGQGAYAGSIGGMDEYFGGIGEGIDSAIGVGDKQTEWAFTFNLPTSCSALEVYQGVTIDPCRWQPTIHSLMSMIWIAFTMAFGIHMVGSTLRGK